MSIPLCDGRKPVWAVLRKGAQAAMVGDMFRPLPPGSTAEVLQGRQLGAARLRLLPKATGALPEMQAGPGESPKNIGARQEARILNTCWHVVPRGSGICTWVVCRSSCSWGLTSYGRMSIAADIF